MWPWSTGAPFRSSTCRPENSTQNFRVYENSSKHQDRNLATYWSVADKFWSHAPDCCCWAGGSLVAMGAGGTGNLFGCWNTCNWKLSANFEITKILLSKYNCRNYESPPAIEGLLVRCHYCPKVRCHCTCLKNFPSNWAPTRKCSPKLLLSGKTPHWHGYSNSAPKVHRVTPAANTEFSSRPFLHISHPSPTFFHYYEQIVALRKY